MFTSEFCEISKNTFFHREHLWWLFRDWFPLEFVLTYNISLLWREINSKHWISSRANQKKIKNSRNKYVMWTFLNFDQLRIFPDNYKPLRVWLWLVYKFTENYCRLQTCSEFFQKSSWQNTYPNLTTTCHSHQAKDFLVN